jgi:ferredoxin
VISRRELFTSILDKVRDLAAPSGEKKARVVRGACLAWRRSFCTVCVERCPVERAITMDKGRPVIDPSLCDGCGICADVCPSPMPAIVLERPSK